MVYNTWRMHLEWPRLHLTDFVHSYRYFRPEHVCADCAYNSWPNKTGVHSHITPFAHINPYATTAQFTECRFV